LRKLGRRPPEADTTKQAKFMDNNINNKANKQKIILEIISILQGIKKVR